jgi:ketosteroid isomerase-like protein
MMKYLLGVALVILTTATMAFGQCSDADKKKLEAFDRAWGEAGVRGDRPFLQNVYGDNYVGLSPAGMLTKTQTIDATVKQADVDRARPQDVAKISHDYYMISCTPMSATITHRNVISGTTDAKAWTTYTRSVHFLERSGDQWAVVSNAGQPLNDEGILLYMEQEWNDAAQANNVAWFERNYAGDATDISSRTGVVHSKAEEIASMKSNKDVLDSLELSDLNVRVEANAAIVTGINRVKGHDAKGQTFDRKTSFTDTYIKRDGRWQVWATQGTLITP